LQLWILTLSPYNTFSTKGSKTGTFNYNAYKALFLFIWRGGRYY